MKNNTPIPPQKGDETELFVRYQQRLLAVVSRAASTDATIVEDACQFAWAQLFAEQPERESIFSWLCKVAVREAWRLHKLHTREATDTGEAPDVTGVEGDPELALALSEALDLIAQSARAPAAGRDPRRSRALLRRDRRDDRRQLHDREQAARQGACEDSRAAGRGRGLALPAL